MKNRQPQAEVSAPRVSTGPYALFSRIDGSHSFKDSVPGGFVDYQVRKRRGGKVVFFNFELAKEMGLLPADHPHRLNPTLVEAILDTFALVIINEWDIQNGKKFPKKDIKPNRYMATRYLQLQHPDKRGTTSGDGRGIWNGEFQANGATWDISSSGTGATCLSPAVAIEKKFFRTGDPRVCYGSGYNTVDDGFNTALMSEILHQNGVATERTLTIIEFSGGTSINVRAAKNLLRPSHFFHHLKQGNLERLRGSIDFFIRRQVANGVWAPPAMGQSPYDCLGERMALDFSRLAAQFESEYIFCWMDWDGDNILAAAGIIDYGSVRQFGLFHDEYRYDDVDRFSTKLTEQKAKARYLVQTFAQIRDFLKTGRKRGIHAFVKDPMLKLFDRNFERCMDEFLLRRMGLDARDAAFLLENRAKQVRDFRKVFAHFERAQSRRGIYKVSDGIKSDAIFCMRDGLREFPRFLLNRKTTRMPADEFIEMLKSSYARKGDLHLNPRRRRKIEEFQSKYLDLVESVAQAHSQGRVEAALLKITMRSSLINRADRITGDAVIHATDEMLRLKKSWPQSEVQALFERIVQMQVFDPVRQKASAPASRKRIRDALKRVQEDFDWLRQGI